MIWPGYWFRVVANTIFIARWPHLFKTLGTVVSLLLSYGLLLLANGLFSTLLGVRSQLDIDDDPDR